MTVEVPTMLDPSAAAEQIMLAALAKAHELLWFDQKATEAALLVAARSFGFLEEEAAAE